MSLRLNLGSGDSKIDGFVNVDLDHKKGDAHWDISHRFPYEDGTVDEIWMLHILEHVKEFLHRRILEECFRVLKVGGILLIAYPEFKICAQRYIDDWKGKKDFYKACIYGRQNTDLDYHVTLMDTDLFVPMLIECGFVNIESVPEKEDQNTLLRCVRSETPQQTREDLLRDEIFHV